MGDAVGNVYLGLVHYPVKNKRGKEVVTSVTNLDIHDIARSCCTFGIKKYFIITPLQAQKVLINRILGHWEEEKSLLYNPDRKEALSIVEVIENVELAVRLIEERENGKTPLLAVTGANFNSFEGGVKRLRDKMILDNRPCFLLFGTGWGLSASIVDQADFRLAPILGETSDGYNHLSVRSAVAIYLDRLRGGL